MSEHYADFTTDDFIADPHFQQWVRFPNDQTDAWWQEWISKHPGKKQAVLQAAAFISALRFNEELPSSALIEASLSQNLHSLDQLNPEQPLISTNRYLQIHKNWLYAAAILLLCFVIGYWKYNSEQAVTLQMVTKNLEVKTFLLPDSSQVTLNANSSISYTSGMMQASKREVWLEGEAFFEVKHIEKGMSVSRFVVHSGDLNVEVLGTSFNVKKRSSVTNVTLNSGKIKIDLQDIPQTAVYLQPGDFVQYSSNEKHLLKKHVKPELYSVWKDEKMLTDNMPLQDIAGFIEDAYGYKISIPDRKLAASKISGTLRLKDEESLLETLAFALDIEIIRKDSLLLFEPKKSK